jgi:hypothetical protein
MPLSSSTALVASTHTATSPSARTCGWVRSPVTYEVDVTFRSVRIVGVGTPSTSSTTTEVMPVPRATDVDSTSSGTFAASG